MTVQKRRSVRAVLGFLLLVSACAGEQPPPSPRNLSGDQPHPIGSGPAIEAEGLQVEASLKGYNLLWPTPRCCAFTLEIRPNGSCSVIVRAARERRETSFVVPPRVLEALRLVLREEDFFSLPQRVGAMIVDGDMHKMTIRLGAQAHTVTLYDWPDDWANVGYLSKEELEHTRRAYRVWRLIRALVVDPEATTQ